MRGRGEPAGLWGRGEPAAAQGHGDETMGSRVVELLQPIDADAEGEL